MGLGHIFRPSFRIWFSNKLHIELVNPDGVGNTSMEFGLSHHEQMRLVEEILSDSGLPSYLNTVEQLKEANNVISQLRFTERSLRHRIADLESK